GARLVQGHDLFDRQALIRPKPRSGPIAPDDAGNDHVIPAADLDRAAFRTRATRLDHQSARGNVENADVAPLRAGPQPCRQDHSAPELTGALSLAERRERHWAPRRPPLVSSA